MPVQIQLFVANELCQFQLGPEQDVVVRRGRVGNELLLSDPGITTNDEGAARFHVDGDDVQIVPTASGGPILLNGTKLTEPAVLRDEDRIRIGFTTLIVKGIGSSATCASNATGTQNLNTVFLKRRDVLDVAANELKRWSEALEHMLDAKEDVDAAGAMLRQLLNVMGSRVGLVACGTPPRSLRSCGLSSGEEDSVILWLTRLKADSAVQLPAGREIFGPIADAAGWITGKYACSDGDWWFAMASAANAHAVDQANRALAIFRSLVNLHRRLHSQRRQSQFVDQLSQTVKMFCHQPAEEDELLVASRMSSRSEVMKVICRLIARAAVAPCPVLLMGEPGTGKQVAAETIHAVSARRHREMVALSLVESPEGLVENQLFGHAPRAFTGAGAQLQRGLIEQANGATLFLDEIGETPLTTQAMLLRVLEYGTLRRIGDPRSISVDFRLISATNRDLSLEVQQGTFRRDLYDRISVIPITLPPLRDRAVDIPHLADGFLRDACRRMNRNHVLSEDGTRFLSSQPWPDNVRGLKNFIERVVALSDPRKLTLNANDLEGFRGAPAQPRPAGFPIQSLEQELRDKGWWNRAKILNLLAQSSERRSKIALAEAAGVSKPIVRRELHELIAYCLKSGCPRAFFEERVALRDDDWQKIQQRLDN
jgi:DNA-binding NtrC family response regulator